MRPPSRVLWLIASTLGFAALTLAPGSARPRFAARPAAAGAPQGAADDASTLKDVQPPIPVPEIIRRFAQHESDFKMARGQYTYSQSVLVEEAMSDGGEYQQDSDIIFTPDGKRLEHVTYAPPPSLGRYFSLSPEDMKDLENIQPFVLTTEDLPKYDVNYAGEEKIDELNTYVFRVGPKRIEKNQRYFQGTIWVEDHDYAIVKSDGKAVPDIVKGANENLFPRFVTYRENIEGNFWFPTYTHADDILRFSSGDVHIRETVRYKNYKRFGSTIRLGESKTLDGAPAGAAPAAPQK